LKRRPPEARERLVDRGSMRGNEPKGVANERLIFFET
jgi:hypothetical protein